MRGIFRRGPRLELVRGLVIALAVAALSVVAAHAIGAGTTTTLTATATQAAEISPAATCTLTNLAVVVTGTEGVPAGTVAIEDGSVQLATATLVPSSQPDSSQANFVLDLPNGSYSLSAVNPGDGTAFPPSTPVSVSISSQCDSAFVVTASTTTQPPTTLTTLTLTPGQAGTAVITVTPSHEFVSSLTGPAFITISCSGLSDLATCASTPENIEILPGQNAGVASSMVIQTYAASTTSIQPASRPGKGSSPISWAFLLPGALALGGLGWCARRRSWAKRISLLALVGLVTLLGTTACNPRYYYEHHGPIPNPPTPAGSYTVKVAAQTSNGVTAAAYFTSFELTVK